MLWDLQNRQARLAAFLPHLRAIAEDHRHMAQGRLGPRELMAAAIDAFELALDRFDPKRDYDLHAYVDIVVRGALHQRVLNSHRRRARFQAA